MGLTRDDLTEAGLTRSDADHIRDGAELVLADGTRFKISGPVAAFFATAVECASTGGAEIIGTEETLRPIEAARMLGVSRPMIYRYIEQGILEDRPVGADHRVTAASVAALVDSRRSASVTALRLIEERDPTVEAARALVEKRRANRS